MNSPTSLFLRNGIKIPAVGVGTFKIRNGEGNPQMVGNVLDAALAAGYRMIDTASVYKNEKDIGKSLKELCNKYGLQRSELFITSKLAPIDHGFSSAQDAFWKSLSELDCGYLDLYLIHWPGASKLKPNHAKHSSFRKETWLALEHLYHSGKVKAIGVSNYTQEHLHEMEAYATISPLVNQVEFHPHLYQKDLLKYCSKKEIFVQAYSSLGTGELVGGEMVNVMATKYKKSAAQILLKWGLQHGVGILPKSTNRDHIRQNINLFSFMLSQEDMTMLDELNIQKHYCWDPSVVK